MEELQGLEKPEVVILTAYSDNNILKNEIRNKMECPVITIGELLDE